MIDEPDPEPSTLTPAKAVALYHRIGKRGDENWQDWLKIGRFVAERRRIATAKAGGTTRGPIYADHLRKQLGQFHDHFVRLSENGTLSFIDKCLANLDFIEPWRDRLPVDQRPTRPRNVYEAWAATIDKRRSIAFDDDGNEVKNLRKPSHRFLQHNSAQHELFEARQQIAQLEEQIEDLKMTPDDPQTNAFRTWSRLIEAAGTDRPAVAALAITTGKELIALGRLAQEHLRTLTAPPSDNEQGSA